MNGCARNGKEFSRRDWNLCNAVKRHKRWRDGFVEVSVNGSVLEVFARGKPIFRHNRADGWFQFTTWGSDAPWVRDKINACLKGVGALIRVYEHRNRLYVLGTDGKTLGRAFMFNSTKGIIR